MKACPRCIGGKLLYDAEGLMCLNCGYYDWSSGDMDHTGSLVPTQRALMASRIHTLDMSRAPQHPSVKSQRGNLAYNRRLHALSERNRRATVIRRPG